jgi:arylsulfatase A-like enzyme
MADETIIQQSYPREPKQLKTLNDVQQWIDGYDVAIHYVDAHIGQLIAKLQAMGIYDDTAIIVSSDHGVHLGEMYVWGGQDMADHWVNGVPMIVRWPGLEPRVKQALHYQFDIAATLIELSGGAVPANWDGRSIAHSLRKGEDKGRDYLILSHAAMTAQRAVRFDNYICLRTYHDGYKLLDPVLLFNVRDDPHELRNLATDHEGLVDRAMHLLSNWQMAMLRANGGATDPLVTVLHEGGPFHVSGQLPAYLEHLRATGRAHLAERLRIRHPSEVEPMSYHVPMHG